MVCRHVHVYHSSVGTPQGLLHTPGGGRHQSISFSTVSRFERLTTWPALYIGHVVSNGNKFQLAGGCRQCQRWDESDQYEPEAHTTRSGSTQPTRCGYAHLLIPHMHAHSPTPQMSPPHSARTPTASPSLHQQQVFFRSSVMWTL